MHTDEYEISLSREITVCNKFIAKIGGELARLEQKHGMTTADFVRREQEADGPKPADRTRWLQKYEALRSWQQRLREYEEALAALKDD
jgi:hypothetical protein